MTLRICCDAGAVENLHARRGIGQVARHLLPAMDAVGAARPGTELSFLKRGPFTGPLLPLAERGVRRSWSAEWTGVAEWPRLDRRLRHVASTLWKTAETGLSLPRDVAATGADVFFTPDPDAVAASPAFRTVAMLYDLVPRLFPAQYLPRAALAARAAYGASLRRMRRAHRLVAISHATRRDGIRLLGLDPTRVSVAHLAVDTDTFRPVDRDAARARVAAEYGLDAPFFVYVGGFDARKNVPRLLRAFAGVPAPLRLAVVGPMDGPGERLRASLRESAGAERVSWLGHVPTAHLPLLYAASCGLAFPSLYEGFGLPVLEAMSCGAPVMTSRISALPEVAGDAALYVDPESEAAIAETLRRLAAEPGLRDDLRARGLEQARRFSWARTAGAVLDACAAAVR